MRHGIPKIERTREELEASLQTQLRHLERSADSFDAGNTDEAARMAVAIRILFHESRTSHSLLGQLGLKNIKFQDSSSPINNENMVSEFSLVHAGLGGADGQQYIAPLAEAMEIRRIPAENWWKQTVLRNQDSHRFSRASLIFVMANQDGGAHVDPSIDAEYRDIAEGEIGFQFHTDGEIIKKDNAIIATVRQIAHEVLASLVKNYNSKRKKLDLGVMIGPISMVCGNYSTKKHSPNKLCPCSSGLKYKKCHGSPPIDG